jgi:hypothetical protein
VERRTPEVPGATPVWQDRGMSTDAPVTPVTRGSFWRRRAIDLLLVASAGCTRARLR